MYSLFILLLSDPVIFIFSSIILSLFSFILFSFFMKKTLIGLLGDRLAFSAPTLLTSIGILGTFVGIIYSLLDFNTSDLDSSIPQLLDGMKIAFLTSVIGMASSIILKVIMLVLGKEDENKENAFFIDHVNKQTELLQKLSDHSLYHSNNFKAFENNLVAELNNFTQNLSDKATQHIIDALEDIVMNFNERLANQFGDNFAKFGDSVEALLEWQENYKLLLTKKMDKYDLNAKTLAEVKDSMLEIEAVMTRIPDLIRDFESLIKFNQKQIGKIGDQMSIFADVKDKALDTFPEIENYFIRMADSIEASSNKFNDLLYKHSQQTANNLSNLTNKMADDFLRNSNVISVHNDDTMNGLISSTAKLNDLVKSLDQILSIQFSQLQQSFNQSLENLVRSQMLDLKKIVDDMEVRNNKLLNDFSEKQEEKSKSLFGSVFDKFKGKDK